MTTTGDGGARRGGRGDDDRRDEDQGGEAERQDEHPRHAAPGAAVGEQAEPEREPGQDEREEDPGGEKRHPRGGSLLAERAAGAGSR